MKVRMHRLFEYLLKTTEAEPEAVLGFSLAEPPRLGEFLADLDPELPLDWSNKSFQGLPALREHILRISGLESVCTPEDVLITAGAAEANFLVMAQLLNPEDRVIIERPGWPQPWVLAEPLGAEAVEVSRRESEGWRVDIDALEEAMGERTRLIFLTNPNNPTGAVTDADELEQIVRIAERAGAHLLVDEVYAGLEWDGPRAPAVAGLYERGISTGSVSKVLGLQGLRIGWMICRDAEVIRDAVELRENTSEIMNVLGEVVAEIALRPGRYSAAVERAKAAGRENLELLDGYIESRPELSWQRPKAGLIGLARLGAPLNGDELAERLLAPPYRTFLIPGSAYGFPEHIRLGVGGGEEVQLEKGLERLAACLDDL